MAEIWEIVIWVIFAIVLALIIAGIITSIYICTRRKKKARRRRIRWNSGDEIDYASKRAKYNVQRGDIEMLNETDAGEKSTQEKAVVFYTKNEEGTSSDKTGKNNKENSEESNVKRNFVSDREIHVSATETTQNPSQSNASYVTRERLQPVKLVPIESINQEVSNSVNNYTNLGYSEQNQVNSYHAPVVRFQQPTAVVRTFVHPGATKKSAGKTKSLPRSFSRMEQKKTSSLSHTQRPVSYHWSLEAKSSNTCPSWVTVPIRIKSTDRLGSQWEVSPGSPRDDSELERDRDYKRWSFRRSLRGKDTRRSLLRRSLRKQRESRVANSRFSHPVYITDSPVKASSAGNSYQSSKSYHYQPDANPGPLRHKSPYTSVAPSSAVTNHNQQSQFSEKTYKMVKRSEFPGSPQKKGIEPDMVSVCSSEFSDLPPREPPRPSDNVSINGDESSHSNTTEMSEGEYTRGSYKEYSSRIKSSQNTKAAMVGGKNDDRRHSEAFHGTLESLKNNSHQRRESSQNKEFTGQTMGSSWFEDDDKFRREHGIPDTGVPVLPRQPVHLQTVDTDTSDDTIR